ncbi:MAG: patatin-like phospholipase family protein [Propionibacteriaceae bacterium]|jgi:NTE family protein|nr:patatin-like phospholipase family protein [Propionibacteriaceae bacterium]
MAEKRALVVGGGGVTGIAWATGMLFGLEQAGVHLRQAERLVGTSAGSAIAAQLIGPASLEELYERQLAGTVQELPGALAGIGMLRVMWPLLTKRDHAKAMRTIGRYALGCGVERAAGRRAVIEQRVDGVEWDPERDLGIVAINIDTGERVVFRAGGPASLTDAVEASCAVPGVWPVVTIDGVRYMDGGISSPAHVDLAGDAGRVVVLAPLVMGVRGRAPGAQLAALDCRGLILTPDAEAKEALGSNPLDPAARVASAQAGLAQAGREVDQVRGVWAG